MQNITIITGPNLNLLGVREPEIYGSESINSVLDKLRQAYPGVTVDYFQSNHEGDLIDCLQKYGFEPGRGIVLNAGAYTHTSLAIADCIAAIKAPVVEVHISNVHAREPFRHQSMLSRVCRGVILGFGTDVYRLAIEALLKL